MREFGTIEVVMEGFGAIWRLVLGFGTGGAFFACKGLGTWFWIRYGQDGDGWGLTVVLASLGSGRTCGFHAGIWTNRGSYGQMGLTLAISK